jgi:hypothetical protein
MSTSSITFPAQGGVNCHLAAGSVRAEYTDRLSQKLEALNSRLERANRIHAPYAAVDFVTTDLLDIDQTQTSAAVRADSQAVTLKERATSTNAVIQTQGFSTSDGTAQAISTDNSLYRVQVLDSGIPTGTSSLQLVQSLSMTVLTFDLAAMPPTPGFVVSASPDGTTFTQATQVSVNGYRLTAWFPPMEMLYISLAITPAAPDTLVHGAKWKTRQKCTQFDKESI